jgi:mRNA interferase RelE/StbE
LRIIKFLRERLAFLENPRTLGAALSGSTLGDYWKYRVGDYRIIVEFQDRKLCVQIIAIGNRREIYR